MKFAAVAATMASMAFAEGLDFYYDSTSNIQITFDEFAFKLKCRIKGQIYCSGRVLFGFLNNCWFTF